MSKAFTTADVPPQFLKAAFLVGHVPWRLVTSDPRISYALYIPPSHYNANPQPSGEDHTGSTQGKLPLLVYVHGTLRNVSALYNELPAFAESTPCAILVPLFPAGIDGPNDLGSYKTLRSATLRSDLALLSMLDEIGRFWLGIETSKVFLMGFSGGGQFAHRFLYLYPERLAAISVGAPGETTTLSDEHPWPRGVANVKNVFEREIRKDLIRQVRIQLIIGGADVEVHGGEEFWAWLKQMKGQAAIENVEVERKEARKLRGRQNALQEMQALWKEDDIEAQLDVVEGVSHASAGVIQQVLHFLEPLVQEHR